MSENQMKIWMRLAAIYNIIWGAWVVLFPQSFFTWMDMEPLRYPTIWQGTGMIVGVYGFGYWWSSYDPMRHWPIILVGFLGKIFGPLGYVMNVSQDLIDPKFGYLLITNDLLWWIPFFLILKKVHTTTKWKLTDEKS
ncbi:MAG: alkyl hydroperoxide reductase [Vicingaceae bacterium]